jgi:hypothetical protein
MPKVVVYVRAEDARTIEAATGQEIGEWTRQAIQTWKAVQAERNAGR